MIINLSNHPHANWQEKQIRAAEAYGEIIDLPFPQVSPTATEEDQEQTALQLLRQIREMKPDAVVVMGEFSLVFLLVDALLDDGIPVLTSASSRVAVENRDPDGTVLKTVHFDFVRFRPYRRLRKQEVKQMGVTADGVPVLERQHTHVHYEDGLTDEIIREAISRIIIDCPVGEKQAATVSFDEPVGRSCCITLTDDQKQQVQWVQRPGRSGATPMISGVSPAKTDRLTVAVLRTGEREGVLLTAYAGDEAPPEPWSPRLTDEERKASEEFWSIHALILPEQQFTEG